MQISNIYQDTSINQQKTITDTAIHNNYGENTSTVKGKNTAAGAAAYVQIETAYEDSYSVMNTDKGNLGIDLDNLFANERDSTDHLNIGDLPPLLLPSSENIKAISEHVSARFKQMLTDYNIPSAPENITFDNQGKIQIPNDYPYADELNHALEENPGIKRELSTLNALSSHFVEIQKRMPFIDEISQASSQAEQDIIIAKYSHLLNDNHSYSSISLLFSKEGDLSVSADGQPVKLS